MKYKTNCSEMNKQYATALNEMDENANEIECQAFSECINKLLPDYDWKSKEDFPIGSNRYYKSTFFGKPCVYIRNRTNEYLLFSPELEGIVMHVLMQPIWEHIS